MVAATGTNVRALGEGVVVRSRDHDSVSGYHQEVTVWYEAAFAYTLYGHLLANSLLPVGKRFGQGDILGQIGTSRDAMFTVPHAHIQCWKDKSAMVGYNNLAAIDPARVRNFYAPTR